MRKLAQRRVGTQLLGSFAKEHGINTNQLSNYLSGYLRRCPPKLQEALGLQRVTVYRDMDHPSD